MFNAVYKSTYKNCIDGDRVTLNHDYFEDDFHKNLQWSTKCTIIRCAKDNALDNKQIMTPRKVNLILRVVFVEHMKSFIDTDIVSLLYIM